MTGIRIMRRKIMGITLPRWYQALPLAVFLFAIGLPIPVFFMIASHPSGVVFYILLALGANLMGFAAMWTSWVLPWHASGDSDFAPRRPPQHVARDLHRLAWAPTIGIWLSTMLASMMVGSQEAGAVFVGGVVLGAMPLLWVIPLARSIRERVGDTARRRQVCFQCGYDLRGNPAAACPECGHRDQSAENTPS